MTVQVFLLETVCILVSENLYILYTKSLHGVYMTQTMVVTTRIKKEVKQILEKAGINISNAVRKHLEELAWKLQVKEETEKLRKLLEKVKPSEPGFAVESVREDREGH